MRLSTRFPVVLLCHPIADDSPNNACGAAKLSIYIALVAILLHLT